MRAISSKDTSVAELLIQKSNKSDINIRSENGVTALFCAAESSTVDVVRQLLNKGADISLQGHFGRTPLLLALDRKNRQLPKS